jgi:hypothetical protein
MLVTDPGTVTAAITVVGRMTGGSERAGVWPDAPFVEAIRITPDIAQPHPIRTVRAS